MTRLRVACSVEVQVATARPSMTQDTYMGRKLVDRRAADALLDALGGPKDHQAEDDEVE